MVSTVFRSKVVQWTVCAAVYANIFMGKIEKLHIYPLH